MSSPDRKATAADVLVTRLREFGVRHVFGYPGGPLTPLYDALYREPAVRHVLARDEQGAGFMADGYARAGGHPGVCLAVCGPGVFNAATPLATAYSDSVPLLLISGQVPPTPHGPRSGYYHENDQLAACVPLTKWRAAVPHVDCLIADLDQAWLQLTEGRPGPVLLDVPGAVLRSALLEAPLPAPLTTLVPRWPGDAEVAALARMVSSWTRPLLLAGGGVVAAGAEDELRRLAERLGAPVLNTFMGKGALPADHALAAGMTWRQGTSDMSDMASRLSPLFAAADGLLAVGCRFTQIATGNWALKPPSELVQIDIDPAEIGRHYPVTLGLHADAKAALHTLLKALPPGPRPPWATLPPTAPWLLAGMDLSAALRRAVPRDAIVVADVTQLGYRMLVEFPTYASRTFLHPAGSVAMGYALPAAIGAKAALHNRPVVAVMGDGGFQMTGMELATAVQEKLPVVVVVVNDGSLTLIKAIQQRRYGERYLGVDLRNPDFGLFAQAFGVRYALAETETGLENAVREAVASGETALVEMRLPPQRSTLS